MYPCVLCWEVMECPLSKVSLYAIKIDNSMIQCSAWRHEMTTGNENVVLRSYASSIILYVV